MALDFKYRFEPATDPDHRALLLLHGTGGDESDLFPLGRSLCPGAALLAPRGKVLERGMPRFFGRLADGVFDPDEVRQRSRDLADFVKGCVPSLWSTVWNGRSDVSLSVPSIGSGY